MKTNRFRKSVVVTMAAAVVAMLGACGFWLPPPRVRDGFGNFPDGWSRDAAQDSSTLDGSPTSDVTDPSDLGPDGGQPDSGNSDSSPLDIGMVCPAGQTACPGGCTNLTSDLMNCGACGVVCGAGQPCSGGCGPTNETCATAIVLTPWAVTSGTTCHAGMSLTTSACGSGHQVFFAVTGASTMGRAVSILLTGPVSLGLGPQTFGCGGFTSISDCEPSSTIAGSPASIPVGMTFYFAVTASTCADFTVMVHP